MILRATLAALLTAAFIVTAVVHCCVGLSFDAMLSHAPSPRHSSTDHDGDNDCGKSERRVCDAMVQSMAPQTFVSAPLLASHEIPPVVPAAPLTDPAYVAARRTDRPPDRASSFKDFHAKTGRLLI